jgi:glycosyltransferase involved in cell wall biosynthesis
VAKFDVTVIIPTFNSAKLIGNAIDSVSGQGGVDTQIVVVDGASTDATCEVVRQRAAPGLALVSEPDRGIYDAINKGIALAEGALIGVLGSDDRYTEGALALAVAAHRAGQTDIVAGRTNIGGVARADEAYGVNALISGIPFGHNAMFAGSKAYRTVGLYNIAYKICADADWVHRAIRMGLSCTRVDAVFVEFGEDGTSSIRSDVTMDETYAVIRSNFKDLSLKEAKALLYAVRGWGLVEDPKAVAARHGDDALLAAAVAAAFPASGVATRRPRRVRTALRRALNGLSSAASAVVGIKSGK